MKKLKYNQHVSTNSVPSLPAATSRTNIKEKGRKRRKPDIPIRIIRNTGQSVIPRGEGGEEGEEPAGLDDGSVRHPHRVAVQVPNAQQQEGQVEREEEREEGDGRAERAEHEDEGEDEPALWGWLFVSLFVWGVFEGRGREGRRTMR